MANCGPFIIRHTEMFWDTKEKFKTRSKAVFLVFSWVFQKIFQMSKTQ